jgi:transposase
MHAVAHALEGYSGAEAARLAGMERQAPRDAVPAFNDRGFAGLYDRPRGRSRCRLSEAEQASLKACKPKESC